MMTVWSSGGGTQSAAIAALICAGKLPQPDLSVIVDTEREKTATWEYHDAVIVPRLREAGVEIARVAKSDFATVDLYSASGKLLLPAFTSQAGRVSRLSGYCSNEWKKRVVYRWLRSLGVRECEMWLGISTDEARRMAFSGSGWVVNRYPLIEAEYGLQWRRIDCVAFLDAQGWPPPPRSACWMCPYMTRPEWQEMQRTHPDDYRQAQALETLIREQDPQVWLRPGRLLADEGADVLGALPGTERDCEGGHCFV